MRFTVGCFIGFIDTQQKPLLSGLLKGDNRIPFKWRNYICLFILKIWASSPDLQLLYKDKVYIKQPIKCPQSTVQSCLGRGRPQVSRSPPEPRPPWAGPVQEGSVGRTGVTQLRLSYGETKGICFLLHFTERRQDTQYKKIEKCSENNQIILNCQKWWMGPVAS